MRARASTIRRARHNLMLLSQRLLAQVAQGDARGERLGVGLDVDDRGLGGGERPLERRGEIFGLLDRLAMAAEGAGVGCEVGVLELGAVDACRILALLMHADGAL